MCSLNTLAITAIGLIIFSTLGHLAQERNLHIGEVIVNGKCFRSRPLVFFSNCFRSPFRFERRICDAVRVPDDPAVSHTLGSGLLSAALLHRYRLPGKLWFRFLICWPFDARVGIFFELLSWWSFSISDRLRRHTIDHHRRFLGRTNSKSLLLSSIIHSAHLHGVHCVQFAIHHPGMLPSLTNSFEVVF